MIEISITKEEEAMIEPQPFLLGLSSPEFGVLEEVSGLEEESGPGATSLTVI